MRRLTYFVATSLDGFIAGPDGSFDAFPMQGDHIEALFRDYPETLPAPALNAMGITPSNATFDTVLMGWNTFAAGFSADVRDPYPHLRQYVFSRTHSQSEAAGKVIVTAEDPRHVVQRLKSDPSLSDIWLCGGGRLASQLERDIDRLVLKVNPVVLGAGIRLFESERYDPHAFRLTRTRVFDSGVVMSTYDRV